MKTALAVVICLSVIGTLDAFGPAEEKRHMHRRNQKDNDDVHDQDEAPAELQKLFPEPVGKRSMDKRGGRENFLVELLFVADYSVFQHFQNFNKLTKKKARQAVKDYLGMFEDGLNTVYESMDNNVFNVRVKIVDILVAEDWGSSINTWSAKNRRTFSNSPDSYVDGKQVLPDLTLWRKKNEGSIPAHDHVMAFTMYDIIVNGGQSTVGYAYTKAICGTSVSVVELLNGDVTQHYLVAAHELGHSLGAHDHDGTNNAAGCAADSNYVMSANAASAPYSDAVFNNRYAMSQCSIDQIGKHIDQNDKGQCLLVQNNPNPKNFGTDKRPGQVFDIDTQCRHMFKDHAWSYARIKKEKPEDVCRVLSCTTGGYSWRYKSTPALPGTTCGNKKWCHRGQCVYNSKAPSTSSGTCPWGDEPGMNCALNKCNGNRLYQARCCSTCDVSNAPRGCWDTAAGCVAPGYCHGAQIYGVCCGTCKPMK